MSEHFVEPPAPGDPRSTGPRPAPGWRDWAWVLLATVVVSVTVVQLAVLAYVAATDPDVAPTSGMLLLAFVVTVVWLLTVYWLGAGAWRRTVWGCPFEHLEDAPRLRRCPRHRLVGAEPHGRAAGPGDDGAPPAPSGR